MCAPNIRTRCSSILEYEKNEIPGNNLSFFCVNVCKRYCLLKCVASGKDENSLVVESLFKMG